MYLKQEANMSNYLNFNYFKNIYLNVTVLSTVNTFMVFYMKTFCVPFKLLLYYKLLLYSRYYQLIDIFTVLPYSVNTCYCLAPTEVICGFIRLSV